MSRNFSRRLVERKQNTSKVPTEDTNESCPLEPLSSLRSSEKESIILLLIGTFLEYFDLFLYVHMAILINDLFFPVTNAHTKSLLASFALCSSLAFRPIGAFIFGWIGDRYGRKPTIVLTTFIMAFSCLVMASLPTYAQIGIAAAWIMIICRLFQGLSSMGEIVGANIYITETVKRPERFPLVAGVDVAGNLGQSIALGIALLVATFGFNWRISFGIGAVIAIIGAFARTRLKETPEFIEMKRKDAFIREEKHKLNNENPFVKKTLRAYFFISCGTPLSFYLGFFHFNPMLEQKFGYTGKDILIHNILLSFIILGTSLIWTFLSCRMHPLRILKTKGRLGFYFLIFLPFFLINVTNHLQLFIIQSLLLILSLEEVPAAAVFLGYLPTSHRFTYASLLYSLSRALVYIVTAFGTIYLVKYVGHFGLWIVSLPIAISFLYGISYFENMERNLNLYPNLH